MPFDLFNKPSGRTTIVMPSGFAIDLLAPDATGMPIEDIALCLASQPRWGGAARPWYSVAEHSVLVSHLVAPKHAYDALMHDCEEFLGDWPSPAKEMLGRDLVKQKIGPIKAALAAWFGFAPEVAAVKRADLVAMATELRDLLPPSWIDWGHLPLPAVQKIVPVGPERAYALFLERYHELQHPARPAGGRRRVGKSKAAG